MKLYEVYKGIPSKKLSAEWTLKGASRKTTLKDLGVPSGLEVARALLEVGRQKC